MRLQGEAKVWLVQYTVADGQRRKISLGDVASMALADARKQRQDHVRGQRRARPTGTARGPKRAGSRHVRRSGRRSTWSRYAEREQKPRTLVETTRALKSILCRCISFRWPTITRRDVAARLQDLVDSSGPIMANRTRAALSHCFAWAMQQGLAENNPVIGTARPAPEVKRERTLSHVELRQVWNAAGDDDYGRIVKVLILTGQRRDEVGGMAEVELDRDRAMWVLPPERTKNGREHEVPLAPLALAIIGEAREAGPMCSGAGAQRPTRWEWRASHQDASAGSRAGPSQSAASTGASALAVPWRAWEGRCARVRALSRPTL